MQLPPPLTYRQLVETKLPFNRLVREPERLRITGISKSLCYSLEKGKDFPQRVKILNRTSAWKLNELNQWATELPASSHGDHYE
ncbi:AlpA family phage regulatory protein [Paraferrimonas sp. SM1919]|uniref:AlpA family phage regulatory protein n=1 Tax=Paraferrimonas sp. SM1919 TaxID=2662263 RepID=UPI0013D2F041